MSSPRTFLFSLEQIGIKLGLEQIRGLLNALDNPDRYYRSIIVAGTNGKGSVSAMIERGLRAAGYRTGRYTSPHLVHLEERFAISGVDVTARALDESLTRVAQASRRLPAPPTFFEATTAAALDLFRTEHVEVAILEVGLGGRLDATNAVEPIAAAITAIDFDHQQWLGNTIEDIAREKAGVIKAGTVVVLGDNPPAVEAIIAERCRATGAELVRSDDGVQLHAQMVDGRAVIDLRTPRRRYAPLTLALRGRHQVQNAATAVRLLEEVGARGVFEIPPEAVRTAVEDVVWPARLELVESGGRQILIDGAHNASGARALAAYLRDTYGRPVPVVLGVLRDKDAAAIVAPIAAAASHIVCTAPQSPRALRPDELAAVIASCAPGTQVSIRATPQEAVAAAAQYGAPVVVAGSLYLAGEIRGELS